MNRTNFYSKRETIENIVSFFYTKFFWKDARLIRMPIHVRGKKSIVYGKGLTVGYWGRLSVTGRLLLGKNVVIGDFVQIEAHTKIEIGNDVLIASRVFITDTNHGNYSGEIQSDINTTPNERVLNKKEVIIGDRVWIGENVSILPGVFIGEGCIIGANAVVTKSFPPGCILAGVPAKIIKKYNPKKGIWEHCNNE